MKQTFQTKSSLLLPFLLLVILSSCYKNEEGCLDQFASNFSFSADDPCEDCCKYPNLKITFNHNFDSLKMRLNDTLTLDSISYFNVLSISYYLSGISIFPSTGFYEAIDSIEYIDEDTKLSLVNNNALINGLRSNITLNRIKGDATINQVDFNFGLPPE